MALSPERKALLDRLVREKYPITGMHKQHGFNYKTVRKYYPDYRVGATYLREDRWQVPVVKSDKIFEMADEGAPASAIMAAVGVTESQVRYYAPEAFWTKSEAGHLGGLVAQIKEKEITYD